MSTSNTLPEKFIAKLHRQFDENTVQQILTSFQHTNPVTFRVNTLKTPITDIKLSLAKQGFEITPIRWYSSAFILENRSKRELMETDEYKSGAIYIQNLSSMIPVIVLDPQPHERVLDITSAPGSKTTQMAVHMQNLGTILANDISRQRMFKLQANLTHQGVTNTTTTTSPAQRVWEHYPEYFDKTLVDAVCSMEGRFNLSTPSSYKDWSEKKVKLLSNQQKFILRSAISATKPGGIIVYSTCTLSREENEGIIDWILQKEKNSLSIEDIVIDGLNLFSGIADTNQEVSKTKRIIPSQTMEGFYIAKIKKLTSTLPSHLR